MANVYVLEPGAALYPSATLYPDDTLQVAPVSFGPDEAWGSPIFSSHQIVDADQSIVSAEDWGVPFPGNDVYPAETPFFPSAGPSIAQLVRVSASIVTGEAWGSPDVAFWDADRLGPVGYPRIGLFPGTRRYPGHRSLDVAGRLPLLGHGTLAFTVRNVARRAVLHLGGFGFLQMVVRDPTDDAGKLVEIVAFPSGIEEIHYPANTEAVAFPSDEA